MGNAHNIRNAIVSEPNMIFSVMGRGGEGEGVRVRGNGEGGRGIA